MQRAIQNWWLMVLLGGLYLILSPIFFIKPFESFFVLAQFMVIYFFITGIFEILFAITNRGLPNWGWHLAMGLVQTLFGLYILMHSGEGMPQLFVLFLLSFWLIFYGISLVSFSLNLRRLNSRDWVLPMMFGVLSVLSGILVMFYPAGGILFVTTLIGFNSAFLGALSLYLGFRLRRYRKSYGEI